jgi:hypothetical protein
LLRDNEFDNTLVFEMALEDNRFVDDTFNDPLLALSNFKIDLYELEVYDIFSTNIHTQTDIYNHHTSVLFHTWRYCYKKSI